MTKRYFSPSALEFLAGEVRERYIASGTWPDDATEITEDDWQEYGASNAPEGKQLGADKNGLPCWVKESQQRVDIRRQDAMNQIDNAADRVRAADRSIGRYLDAEYQLVAQALIDYRANPDGEVPEAIQSYADAEGLSVNKAAEQIAEAAARTEKMLKNVRRIRLSGKASLSREKDDSSFNIIACSCIEQLMKQGV